MCNTPEYLDLSEVVCHGCGLRYIFKHPIRFTLTRTIDEYNNKEYVEHMLYYEPLNLVGVWHGEFSIVEAIKSLNYVGECVCAFWNFATSPHDWEEYEWDRPIIELVDRVEPARKRVLEKNKPTFIYETGM